MCGIAGFTAPGRDARQWLDRMLDAIAYRGPDGRGTFIDADLALGHLRLAIIDLAGGAQPRVDRATGDALTFNGEIYGYRNLADELRAAGVPLCDQSDTEVLFQLLRRVGVRKALERIGGMFAFAYRDGRTGALHLVRDRFGEKPLYCGVAGVGVVFGSEAGAVRAHPAFQAAAPDLAAAYQLLQFEYVPGQASGWEGIEKVPPGSILTFDNGRVTVERYWRPRVGGGQRAVPEREAVAQL
ncbi:MAG: asparagine synthetase B, partial [Acetobacteraceae bacterium]|nr:asparagine synthetase B [Acetobacteraceae bacterium]